VPKIDWFDDRDDQPRWEPRLRRERTGRDTRDRRVRLEQIIALASASPALPDHLVRRPLHLIWGEPLARPTGDDGP